MCAPVALDDSMNARMNAGLNADPNAGLNPDPNLGLNTHTLTPRSQERVSNSTAAPSAEPASAAFAVEDIDLQLLADEVTFRLAPAHIEARLGGLIRRYVMERSAQVAETIIAHLEALYLHPALRDAPEQEHYRTVARHWRLLVAQSR